MVTSRAIALFTILAAGVLTVRADDSSGATAEDDVFHLGEVIVEADRPTERDLTASVVTFYAADIEAMGARTAADVLRRASGAFVRTAAEGESMIRLRGYRQREVRVFVDGIPINNPYTGRQNLRLLSASNIAEVRVIKGGSSVLYGPNTVGGVVEIITRNPVKRPSADFTAEVGSSDYWRATLFSALPIGRLYSSLSLIATDRDGFPMSHGFHSDPFENGNTRENSALEQHSGTLKLGCETPDSSVGLSLTHEGSEYGLPCRLTNPKFERMEDFDTTRLDLVGERRFSESATGKLSLYMNRTHSVRKGYDDATYSTQDANSYTEDARDRVEGAKASVHRDFGRWSFLSLAYGIERSRRDADGFEKKVRNNGSARRTELDMAERVRLHYVALEDDIRVHENATLSLGVRGDEYRGDERERSLNWNIGLAWDVHEKVRVTPSFYRRTQFPLLRELYEVDRGNPALDPERMTGCSLDVAVETPGDCELSGAAFYEKTTDLIDRDADNVYQNIDEARHRGFEVGLRKTFTKWLSGSVDYAYLDAEDRSGDVANSTLRYRPKHKVGSRITCTTEFGLAVSLLHTYMSKQYVSEDNRDTIRASNVFGVAASQRIGEHAQVFARAENACDYNYLDSDGLPAPGRSFYGGVKLSY